MLWRAGRRIGIPPVRQPKQVIHAGMVKSRQRSEHLRGNITQPQLIPGIGHLRAVQILRQVLLAQIAVLPQAADAQKI